ncbi:MAG: hypothetical protein H7326_04125 [Bdellovibrionaceae bacterium]|nr:hypothetical protein [Pseudobdellovibrionaceae bacterium]
MFERGGFSFVALLVINPIVILLFQNCALIPETQSEFVAKSVAKSMSVQQRSISSVSEAIPVALPEVSKEALSHLSECVSSRQPCPIATVE